VRGLTLLPLSSPWPGPRALTHRPPPQNLKVPLSPDQSELTKYLAEVPGGCTPTPA